MSNFDLRIGEWRTQMARALPQRDELVAELEEHLREHFSHLRQEGKSEDEAFALARQRIGEPDAIAREFDRMPACWRPGLIILPIMAVLTVFLLGGYLWLWSQELSP